MAGNHCPGNANKKNPMSLLYALPIKSQGILWLLATILGY